MKPVKVSILGSTGSIGVNTLDVIARHPQRFHVFALSAASNAQRLYEQCVTHHPRYAVLQSEDAAAGLQRDLNRAGAATAVLCGAAGLKQIASDPEVDCVMAAIVGAAGLLPSLAAAEAGKRILLANKEALVMSGPLFVRTAQAHGATLIPVDSEHNAIFQCLPPHALAGTRAPGIRRILLTASGGPFLRAPEHALRNATPEQACAHPRWVMGRKISVDSATLMNKGLELIEACLLFGVPPATVEVVVHPQAIVHSMVEYLDGSVLAQLSNPDMRTPIAHALGWPERLESGVESLDLIRVGRLEFEAPDLQRFPCLRLARQAAEQGESAPAVLNAANEVAVEAFLQRQLGFTDVPVVIEGVLRRHRTTAIASLDDVLAADTWAREQARSLLPVRSGVCA
ncbi:MAG: 1-deoxy-D-xylulose-5-phosphate reductoisomerase [Steroidobacteraceae bacterium]